MNRYVIFLIIIFAAMGEMAEGGGAVAKRRQAGETRAHVKPRIAVPPVVVSPPVPQDEVKDVADLSDVVASLKISSRAWALLIDQEAKEIVVWQFMQDFRRAGITISKPPPFYVQTIDAMAQGDPQMLQQPFDRLLQVVAIMEYDFDNGQDKDALARKVLSPQTFEHNKKRLGLK